MNHFNLPFSIEPESRDYLLSKNYESKAESYELKFPKNTKSGSAFMIRIKPTVSDLDFELNIHLEEGAEVTLIEDWSSEVKAGTINFRSKIICEENSILKYIILNAVSSETSLDIRRESQVRRNAVSHIYAYHFGSKKLSSRILQEAQGESAEMNTDVIAKADHQRELSFDTRHQYSARNGHGDIRMKGVAEDKGILNFEGLVNIGQKAGGTAGYLNQETLNLSRETIIKATPGLKIDTNDVKTGHGCAIRNLSDEDIFYFGARGIGKEEAKRLLVTGFIGEELKKIQSLKPAYERIKKLI